MTEDKLVEERGNEEKSGKEKGEVQDQERQ
jgi:hypothetical protein